MSESKELTECEQTKELTEYEQTKELIAKIKSKSSDLDDTMRDLELLNKVIAWAKEDSSQTIWISVSSGCYVNKKHFVEFLESERTIFKKEATEKLAKFKKAYNIINTTSF